jgi:hypothetical protein
MEKIWIRDGKNLDPGWKKVGSGCTGTCVGDPRIAEEGEVNSDWAGLPEVRQRRAKVCPILLLEGGVGKPPTELAVARRTAVNTAGPVGRSTTVKERPVTRFHGRKILTRPMLTLRCCCSRRLRRGCCGGEKVGTAEANAGCVTSHLPPQEVAEAGAQQRTRPLQDVAHCVVSHTLGGSQFADSPMRINIFRPVDK